MNKSLKKFLILTQVLGLSALSATACTDNDTSQTKTTSVETKSETKTTAPEPIAKHDPAPDLKNSKHHLKPETVKKLSKLAKGAADVGIAAGVIGASVSNPAAAPKIIKAGLQAAKTVNNIIDKKTEKAVAKAEANEQAEAQAQAQSESQGHGATTTHKPKDGKKGVISKVKGLVGKALHHGSDTPEKPKP